MRRLQVDKGVKVFNVGDEFLMHVFKAHLTASICSSFKINSMTDAIPHENTYEWLRSAAERLVADTLMPTSSKDPVFKMHRTFLHTSFLYVDSRAAIRHENGPHIVRLRKVWLPQFIGTGRKNYACKTVHLLANLFANLPKHVAYTAMHNQTVNTTGEIGHGKPIDQMIENYNL